MKMEFKNIVEFIDSLKQNVDVVGIIEYGNRSCDDMTKGGDYDLTVITRNIISESIGGLHFHIVDIPIDCMIKTVDDFMLPEPSSVFELAHLNSKILFDRDGITKNLLEHIKSSWSNKIELSERDISWFRFTFKHIIDKLEYRLNDDKLYSKYFMSASIDWFIECYAKLKALEIGKPRLHLEYIKENEPILYEYLLSFFDAVNLDEQFKFLKLCAKHITQGIGGLWEKGEVIFHLNTDSVTQYEKDIVYNFIFAQ